MNSTISLPTNQTTTANKFNLFDDEILEKIHFADALIWIFVGSLMLMILGVIIYFIVQGLTFSIYGPQMIIKKRQRYESFDEMKRRVSIEYHAEKAMEAAMLNIEKTILKPDYIPCFERSKTSHHVTKIISGREQRNNYQYCPDILSSDISSDTINSIPIPATQTTHLSKRWWIFRPKVTPPNTKYYYTKDPIIMEV